MSVAVLHQLHCPHCDQLTLVTQDPREDRFYIQCQACQTVIKPKSGDWSALSSYAHPLVTPYVCQE